MNQEFGVLNSLTLGQNGCQFAHDIVKNISQCKRMLSITIKCFSLQITQGPISYALNNDYKTVFDSAFWLTQEPKS